MANNIAEGTMSDDNTGIHASQSIEQSWCHIQETITMLYLAVCQIETAVVESGESMDQLTQSFTTLAQHAQEVNQQLQVISAPEQLGQLKQTVSANTEETNGCVNEAVTAFQFYDRISQRLDHVARSLERMTEVMGTTDIGDPDAWRQIQAEVKSSYSMEAERIMFEHIMQGATVKEALEIYHHHFDPEDVGCQDNGDEVELF